MHSLSYFCLLLNVSSLLIILFDDGFKIFKSCFVKYSVNQRKLLHLKAIFSPKSFRWLRHQKVESQAMYTRTANAEKIYIKTQINMKYLFVNIKLRIWTNWTLKIAKKYRSNSHEELTAHNRAATQWRTQEFCSSGGGSNNSVEDREQRQRGSGGGSPSVRGSGGSCNLVQEIPFHRVKISSFLVL